MTVSRVGPQTSAADHKIGRSSGFTIPRMPGFGRFFFPTGNLTFFSHAKLSGHNYMLWPSPGGD